MPAPNVSRPSSTTPADAVSTSPDGAPPDDGAALPWPLIDAADVEADDFLATVARACGLDAVRYLLAAHGVERVSVPKRYTGPGSRLPVWLEEAERDFGPHLVAAVVEARGGETIYIPAPGVFDEAAKGRRIRIEHNGRNGGALARRYRLSRNKVELLSRRRAA